MSSMSAMAGAMLLALVFGTALAVDVGLHPGYTLMTLRPAGFEPKVAGLEFMPNGDMLVLTWRGSTGPTATDPGTGIAKTGRRTGTTQLYRVTNTKGTDLSAIKTTEIASGFKDAHGLCIVNGEIYVGDIDRIVKLVDKDGDGKYETQQEIGKLPSYDAWFEYAFGPVHKDGKLYMALAVGVQTSGFPTKQLGKDRGTILSVPIGGGTYSVVAEGLRAPNGIAIGPDGEIFTTDNQGGWRPASPFLHVKQNRFYGYRVDPAGEIQKSFRTAARIASGDTVSPPAIWAPYREANDSPTEPALMMVGPYAGQFMYGDISLGGLYRAYLEKVDGEYQGGMIQHSGGLECGMERVRTGENGEVYMGGLGTGSQDNQGWKGKVFGLQKLVPNGTATFEIIRSFSRAKGMELQFSMPVGPSGQEAASYTVQQWYYLPDSNYGGSKRGTVTKAIKSVTLSPDRKRVFLEIEGLKTKQVVYMAAANVKSQEGAKSLWYPKTWYTLNAISPSQPFESAVAVKSASASATPRLRVERFARSLRVTLPGDGAYRVTLLDFQGRKIVEDLSAVGSAELPISERLSGLHIVRAEGSLKSFSRPMVF
ncbi:MAG: hypothetical protein ABIW76_12655 [Fibrobacteria bacterium]